MTIVADINDVKKADVDYLIAQNFYEGRGIPEVFSNKTVAALLGKNVDNFNINIAKRGVDGILDKLVIKGWSVETDGAKDTAAEDDFRDNVWVHAKLAQLLPDALEAAEEYGDAYLLMWPDEDEGATGVDAFLHKPIGARMFYDAGNEQRPVRYVRTWLVRGPGSTEDQTTWYRRVNILTDNYVRKLITSVPAIQVRTDDQFVPFTDEDVPEDEIDGEDVTEPLPPGVSINPYERIPVFHLRTKRPYGVPEHFCLYGCQNLLTKIVVTLGESVDGYGIPWRWRTVNSDKLLKPGSATFGQDQDDEDEEDAADRVRVQAGELSTLYDTDHVGQLAPADSSNLLDPIDKVMQLAATISTTPLDYFDASAAAASGESKKEHKDPYLSKVSKRMDDLGGVITEALTFALADILGHVGASVSLVWQALVERTDAERYQQIGEAVRNGVPWEVACIEAGYDAETVDEWIENGWHPDDSPKARVELFKGVAAGTRDLAAAAQLGGLDVASAQALIAQALTRPERKAVGGGR
jgi:hypothetical protein